MSKIKLYKNNSLVFEKDGNINDNIFEVENIKVDLLNHILYREDASYKYTLDYKQNNANIELKEHNYSLNLLLETKSILKNDEYLRIIYSIESEDKIDNILEIYFYHYERKFLSRLHRENTMRIVFSQIRLNRNFLS